MLRTVRVVTCILAGVICVATAACNEAITSVCGPTSPARKAFDLNRLDAQAIWELLLINGESIPSSGYDLPLSGDRLRSGTLRFHATEAIISDCGKGTSSEILERGVVVAQYLLADVNGAPKFPSKVYTANYEYNHVTDAIVIRAAGEEVSGKRADEDAMTFSKGHVIFGDYSLRFER